MCYKAGDCSLAVDCLRHFGPLAHLEWNYKGSSLLPHCSGFPLLPLLVFASGPASACVRSKLRLAFHEVSVWIRSSSDEGLELEAPRTDHGIVGMPSWDKHRPCSTLGKWFFPRLQSSESTNKAQHTTSSILPTSLVEEIYYFAALLSITSCRAHKALESIVGCYGTGVPEGPSPTQRAV